MDLILGNHDTYYKQHNDVNSPELFYTINQINVMQNPK